MATGIDEAAEERHPAGWESFFANRSLLRAGALNGKAFWHDPLGRGAGDVGTRLVRTAKPGHPDPT